MKKLIVLILVFACFATLLVGCNVTKDDKIIKLNEVTHSVFYAPLYVAMDKGFFEEEGLTIELTNGGGADKSMAAVMGGHANIGLMGPEAAVYVKLQGSTNYPVVFGQLTKRDGSFLISRKPEPNFKWSDLANKEIIGGRKNGMPAMSLEYALKKNNLLIGNNVKVNYDVQYDLITAAFEGGTGDYCTMFEPGASQYQAANKGYIVGAVGTEAGLMPYTCFMATKNYLSDNNEKVTKFMKAIMKGIEFVKTESPEVIAASLTSQFPTTNKDMLAKAVKAYRDMDAYMTNPVLSEESFDNMMELLLFTKAITQKINYSDIIDNSIVKNLL